MQVPAAKIYFPEGDRKQLLKQIDGILQSGQLTLGKYGKKLEQEFAEYVGTKYAVAVNSGTSALEIILRSLALEDSSVVIPANTFFATPASVIHAGGRVTFADITDNLCLDVESVLEAIQKDTKAVIVVHIGGMIPPQIRELQQICKEHNIFLIEDAAHAQGSTLNGKKAGSFGIASAFSFYPTKVMTSGEGGMITTDDEKVNEKALVLRDQGKAGFLENIHTEMGYNWRMSEIHAAIGLSQFARLEQFVADRRRIAKIYDKELEKINGITPLMMPPGVKSNYYKYIALLRHGVDRTSLKKELREKYGVSLSGEVYELPCHLQPIFRNLHNFMEGEYPKAEKLCGQHVCLPVFATMTEEEAKYVIHSLREVIKKMEGDK